MAYLLTCREIEDAFVILTLERTLIPTAFAVNSDDGILGKSCVCVPPGCVCICPFLCAYMCAPVCVIN